MACGVTGKLGLDYASQINNIPLKNAYIAGGLACIVLSIAQISSNSADYFRSQINPPSFERKPSLFKRMYNYFRRPKGSVLQ